MKSDWLMVKKSFSKSWHRRYLKLNGCILTVSKDLHFSHIKHRIIINTQVQIAIKSTTLFMLIMPEGSPTPSYMISCENPDSLIDWVNALKTCNTSQYEIGIDSFDLINVIGRGHFSTVYLAKLFYPTEEYIAIKVTEERNEIAQNEQNLMSKLHNPFIVDFKFYFEFEGKSYLGLEYSSAGDLLNRFDFEVTKRDAKIYASELLLGLDYLHSQGIVLRDLKPENVLIGHDGHLKISDFGLAKFLGKGNLTRSICGTADYCAPEVLKDEEYGMPADVWSYGVVIYELLYGNSPFYCENQMKMYEKITQGTVQFPEDATDDEIEILTSLFKKDPNERPTLEELKKKSFFNSIDWNYISEKKYETDFIPDEIDEKHAYNFDQFEYDSRSI
ncbi:hypothetical protein M9Y10_029685 [Tritrichomonas musculus]|uniref:RAC family serine/threonine-protein kinase like protein n=1 Tax=Tritrichomonas musculus TaxID=1915356 RepID=A0ABR2KNQ1_9EUKA